MTFASQSCPETSRTAELKKIIVHLEIVVIGPKEADRKAALPFLSVLRHTFLPNRVLAGAAEGDELRALEAIAPFAEAKRALPARATAYVCERGRCELPASDPGLFARLCLARRPSAPSVSRRWR